MEYLNKDSIREFWNSRAGLGKWAGTQDVIAKEIEVDAISKYLSDGMDVLEAGCGNGVSAIEYAKNFKINIKATDFAEQMISEAKNLACDQVFKGKLEFETLDILNINKIPQLFDVIYTERVIINLIEWDVQKKAILNLFKMLKRGGAYIMCENSYEGHAEINRMRQLVGLPEYSSPWHNRYLRDSELDTLIGRDIKLESIDYYSSTYYFLSRIIHAAIAKNEGKEPDYDSFVNNLAKKLPPIGHLGQGRIWVWRKI
jgi:ubiquinone/menaquinone biosynthesis C-methylase UbiE